MTDTVPAPSMRRQITTVSLAFAAQNYGFVSLVTCMPLLRDRVGITAAGLSMVLLVVTLVAAGGALLSGRLAVRWGSRPTVIAGLAVQAAGLLLVAFSPTIQLMIGPLLLIGLGMGAVNASVNMQAALTERRRGTPVFGRIYALSSIGSIVSTLSTVGMLSAGFGAAMPLTLGAAVMLTASLIGVRGLDRGRSSGAAVPRAARARRGAVRPHLPLVPLLLLGLMIFAADVTMGTAGNWGTIYTANELGLPVTLAPIGYTVFLVSDLCARLITDALQVRLGRIRLMAVSIAIGVAGCALLVTAATPAVGLAGFALAGAASGTIIPLAYGRAGTIVPERSDEFIARVNLFNYAASLFGAAVPGLIATALSLRWAFGVPLLALLLSVPVLFALRSVGRADPAAPADATAPAVVRELAQD